ncbi:hypothetical protein DPMN_031899 [Dreissena polymorpha]|uniref:Uncharacterized protein n=1 Tax=Dreissena polymorpha TaxID=45954 RepID=A0A9D4M0T2_DREPO|nr:hypothetical protein DPMN_031899 [Dreissena polymorpha]
MTSTKSQPAPEITISNVGIEKLLNSLSPFKAAGPNNINPRVLKELSKEISSILASIF